MHAQRTAFTLVEIMIVVAIIGVMAAIAVVSFARVRTVTLSTCFMNDLRVASQAFESFAMDRGDFPPDAAPGVVPPEMAVYLSKMRWTHTTPIGGQWDWLHDKARAAVQVVNTGAPLAQMKEIDGWIDDGTLTTGLFVREGSNYLLIVDGPDAGRN